MNALVYYSHEKKAEDNEYSDPIEISIDNLKSVFTNFEWGKYDKLFVKQHDLYVLMLEFWAGDKCKAYYYDNSDVFTKVFDKSEINNTLDIFLVSKNYRETLQASTNKREIEKIKTRLNRETNFTYHLTKKNLWDFFGFELISFLALIIAWIYTGSYFFLFFFAFIVAVTFPVYINHIFYSKNKSITISKGNDFVKIKIKDEVFNFNKDEIYDIRAFRTQGSKLFGNISFCFLRLKDGKVFKFSNLIIPYGYLSYKCEKKPLVVTQIGYPYIPKKVYESIIG